ncbi:MULTISPECIES: rRNA maturation RNase YbeY [Duncaniella]|jgi:rRNA maturation RNase YbeY|uniref:rRNA maturation RNase YbeY n=2 Tax=Muribaculaceae TaxID=2005473 RepID=UPI000AEA6094|nr:MULTISPECIES: rRNA maturation RNase YbeY [Duncaniella]MCX4283448.1 rRNA maturation RNase YbeY [Duncaniella dubosii]ROS89209.1 rRNA maturation RNase YbeY [Muribaculaceae bacterium Isolate-080 (Janvier)]HBN63758.1 rRNA maturation RNase YbeY [Porphyromonadaceae bacterium]
MKKIEWLTDGTTKMPDLDTARLEEWIVAVAASHNRIVGPLTYIFCDDPKIIEVNRQFLNHDYFTDIITFDYSRGRMISGDMFISLDTVESNSVLVGATYTRELLRVIIHGVLHLCGINDKGPGEREIMESFENKALKKLDEI